jgi:glycosyltransferase involved in cell wall biosynthesis
MSYVLCLLSPIPVIKCGDSVQTLDLWVRDLQVQVSHTSLIKLVCPVIKTAPQNWAAMAALPAGIEVIPMAELSGSIIASVIADCDVVQVGSGVAWHKSRLARMFVSRARQLGIKSIVGISSNRARSALLNSNAGGGLAKLKGLLKYASIQCAQRHLTGKADGTFVVGDGLRSLVSPSCKRLHVGIASWIRHSDFEAALCRASAFADFPVTRLCIAARFERMKGVHLGIEALAKIVGRFPDRDFNLVIFGKGPELESLQNQVSHANLNKRVQFGGTRSYPTEFLNELRQFGLVLLTNLSDEQPRLVFDAISQGCIPVVPDAKAYQSLHLPHEVFYHRGDSDSLARTIEGLANNKNLSALWSELFEVSKQFTMEAMHAKRAAWIETEILGRSL